MQTDPASILILGAIVAAVGLACYRWGRKAGAKSQLASVGMECFNRELTIEIPRHDFQGLDIDETDETLILSLERATGLVFRADSEQHKFALGSLRQYGIVTQTTDGAKP